MSRLSLWLPVLAQVLVARPTACERLNEALRYLDTVQEPNLVESALEDPATKAVLRKANSLAASADKICGGPEIWSLLTSNPTLVGVQNIKWTKIRAIADGYIEQQQVNMKRATVGLEVLTKAIEEAKSVEHIRDMTQDEIIGFLEAVTAPFGGLEGAASTKCGLPSTRPRADRKAFRTSKGAAESEAAKIFTGAVRVGKAPLLETCEERLQAGPEEGRYCTNLCQYIRDVAQRASDASVGEHTTDMDDLLRKEMELRDELALRQAELSSCQSAKEQLDVFMGEIATLKGNANDKFQDVQTAEQALEDALFELADVEDALKEQEAVVQHAIELLSEADGTYTEASGSLKALNDTENTLKVSLKGGLDALEAAQAELQTFQQAHAKLHALKELVSVTLLKMHLFFEQAVQEPLRNLGITLDMDLSEKFPEPEGLASEGAVESAVDSLRDFCQGEGREAIESVKDKVDLSSICDLGCTDGIKKGIRKTVKGGLTKLKERLEQVRGYLDPYRGQPRMNATVAKGLVEQGEPAYLREVISTFGGSKFYGHYLKHWKFGGKFLELLQEAGQLVEYLNATADQARNKTEGIRERFAEVAEARVQAHAVLLKAAEGQQVAKAKKDELVQTAEEMRQSGHKINKEIEELEKQVIHARRLHKEALDRLGSSHQEWVASGMGTLWKEKEEQLEPNEVSEVRTVPEEKLVPNASSDAMGTLWKVEKEEVHKDEEVDKVVAIRKVPEETTALLQAWEEASAALEPLRTQVSEARDHMVLQKIQADRAERAYNDAVSRLSDAEEGQENLRSLQRRSGVWRHVF